jgi:hypothetical protein
MAVMLAEGDPLPSPDFCRGYRNVAVMQMDHDLDPLRSRPDFQLLMMDLEFPDDPFAPGLSGTTGLGLLPIERLPWCGASHPKTADPAIQVG